MIIDVYDSVLQIYVLKHQPAELRYSHSGVEKDIDHLIVLAVNIIVIHELQELPHVIQCNGFSYKAVIDHHSGKLEAKRVLWN